MQRDVGAVHDAVASYRRCLELDPHNRHAGAAVWLAYRGSHCEHDLEELCALWLVKSSRWLMQRNPLQCMCKVMHQEGNDILYLL